MKDICGICEKVKIVHRNRKTGKLICKSCSVAARYHNLSVHEKCSECGKIKPVKARIDGNKPICPNCYEIARYADASTHKRCFKCGKVKPVVKRFDSGKPICHNCYHRSKIGTCVKCKKVKVIQALGLCCGCYQRKWRADVKARVPP